MSSPMQGSESKQDRKEKDTLLRDKRVIIVATDLVLGGHRTIACALPGPIHLFLRATSLYRQETGTAQASNFPKSCSWKVSESGLKVTHGHKRVCIIEHWICFIFGPVPAYTHFHAHTYIITHTHTYVQSHIYTYSHMHTLTHPHIYPHTHRHVYIQFSFPSRNNAMK